MIEWACSEGARWFELGGMMESSARERGIDEFKRSFGGRAGYALNGHLSLSPLKDSAIELAMMVAARLRRPNGGPAL
jgi:hypothetical protein